MVSEVHKHVVVGAAAESKTGMLRMVSESESQSEKNNVVVVVVAGWNA